MIVFLNSKVEANYSSRSRYLAWNLEGGYQQQLYHWYGVPESKIAEAKASNIDVKHSFYNAHFGADFTFNDTYINSGRFFFRHFGDHQDSAENRFVAKAKVDIPINDVEISTAFKIDYLKGSFKRSYLTTDAISYSNFQIGISPSYQFKQDDLTLNIGVSGVYLNDGEAGENTFYIYPNLSVAYPLVSDLLIVYGGAKGGLIQNSYYGFAKDNPFVSPTLYMQPTNQIYNAFVGLKGKFSSSISYNINGRYLADKNKALYSVNRVQNALVKNSYHYGNSFGVVYDDVNTLKISGEINVDVNQNFKLGVKGEYFNYTVTNETEAWNLPDMKATVFLDYQINPKWYAGANLFYVGERKDQLATDDVLLAKELVKTVVLEHYLDANAHLGYYINSKFSVFAKANNIANKAYEKWQNTPVQSIQFLAGGTYKFDF